MPRPSTLCAAMRGSATECGHAPHDQLLCLLGLHAAMHCGVQPAARLALAAASGGDRRLAGPRP